MLAIFQKRPISQPDRTYLSKTQCGYTNGKVLVCCAADNAAEATVEEQKPGNVLPKPGECGFSLQDKIYGGETTKITDFPWLALMQYTKPDGSKGFHCGGVLINSKYVVTASHVSFFTQNIFVNINRSWFNIHSASTERTFPLIGRYLVSVLVNGILKNLMIVMTLTTLPFARPQSKTFKLSKEFHIQTMFRPQEISIMTSLFYD